jgi:ABC-type taurine transport system substrate-binding protein
MQEPRLIRSAAAFVFVFCTLLISPFAISAGDKPAEQKSGAWMGGSVSAYSADIARFFVSRGQFDKSLDSYDRFVITRFLP